MAQDMVYLKEYSLIENNIYSVVDGMFYKGQLDIVGWLNSSISLLLVCLVVFCFVLFCFFGGGEWSLALLPGWSAVMQSRFTANSDSMVQAVLLSQPPE